MVFFFNGTSGIVAFCITLEQSPYMEHRLYTGIPNDWSIYRIVMASSVANFIALNSAPYVEVVTAPCGLDFHIIGFLSTLPRILIDL